MIIIKSMTLKFVVSCLVLLHDAQSSKLGTSLFTDRALKTRGGYFEYNGSSLIQQKNQALSVEFH